LSKKSRIARNLEEWLRDPSLTPGWKLSEEEKKAQQAKRQAFARAIYAIEAPLVADLRGVGFDVESAWDLFNRKEPWRKDVPIPPWPEAVPVLVEHLGRAYPFVVHEGIVRALTAPWGRVAFDRLVEVLRRTADPQVAAEEQRHAVELVMAEAGDVYTREEVEHIMRRRWESYRFALGNAIVQHLQKEQIPLLVELLRDEAPELRSALADTLQKKMRRWRRKDPELLALVESLKSP
jgi:hypothetical protein